MATMQFAMRHILADFLLRHPKVNLVAYASGRNVDIVGENYDVAIRAHSDPLPDSTLVQRALTPAPWLLFAGSPYLDANETPNSPEELRNVIPLAPRFLCDDMIALKQAAITGLGDVALPGYVCRDDVRSGVLRRVLPAWCTGDS